MTRETIKKFDRVVITDEAFYDEKLNCNIGTVLRLYDEPLPFSKPTPLVEIVFDNGVIHSVGQHEVIIIKHK